MIRKIFSLVLLLNFIACSPNTDSHEIDKKAIVAEVKKMFDDYHDAIKKGGLTAEFEFLDESNDFFWVPPGYNSALTYDSVKTILETNANNFSKVDFHWETLQIFPISNEFATYTGIVGGLMLDTAKNSISVSIIESGTIIKRHDGWKLLCGQSANLK